MYRLFLYTTMSPNSRRRSFDSSSSSSSSDSDSSKKREKKAKKEQKRLEKLAKQSHNNGGFPHPELGGHAVEGHRVAPSMPLMPQEHIKAPTQPSSFPPPYTQAPHVSATAPPASGYRIPLSTTSAFPAHQQLGVVPCQDLDGSPVYFGSALLENSVHPGKITPALKAHCGIPYAGTEYWHNGRYDLLPFDPSTMELVRTSYGQIPHGRRPIEGGYEDHGAKLYHAVGLVDGVRVPGKTYVFF